jgi:thiol-disulfide isomerase/thioredoxin
MSKLINSGRDLQEILKVRDKAMVLFYASWCPFSARFLPIFERYAQEQEQTFLRILVDYDESLSDDYSIAVVPTVIFFENRKISKRLDGNPGVGLNEKKLTDLISVCRL